LTGFAKLEHDPGEAFMRLFVDACMATELKGFTPQGLANTINGEAYFRLSLVSIRLRRFWTQVWPSSSMTPGSPS
jgi:hypothetical protein